MKRVSNHSSRNKVESIYQAKPSGKAEFEHLVLVENRPPLDNTPLVGKTDNQVRYIKAITSGYAKLILAIGPSGVGKTFICSAIAADAIKAKKIDRIIVTRPAVEAGESLGFLPGDLEEKFDPYLAPFKDVFERRLGKSFVEYLVKIERIVASPLAYMRGLTFRDAIVILDEAQNTTPAQMKLFLTRIGENCTVIVNGDLRQTDIKGPNGLSDAIPRLSHIPDVKVITFTKDDIVRSGLVQEIVEAYEDESTWAVSRLG